MGLASGAFVMAAAVGLGTWVGWYLDKRWGTTPWLTLVGVLIGTAAGFVELLRMLKQYGE